MRYTRSLILKIKCWLKRFSDACFFYLSGIVVFAAEDDVKANAFQMALLNNLFRNNYIVRDLLLFYKSKGKRGEKYLMRS